jgi:hypothetical protein
MRSFPSLAFGLNPPPERHDSGVVIVAGVKASKTDEPYSRVPFPARLPIVVQV